MALGAGALAVGLGAFDHFREGGGSALDQQRIIATGEHWVNYAA